MGSGLRWTLGGLAAVALMGMGAGSMWLLASPFERGAVSVDQLESRLMRDHFPHGAIQTAPADPRGVCHDWSLADLLRGESVGASALDDLLAEASFLEVQEPQLGDLAVYRDLDGTIRHTGRVAAFGIRGLLLVESKWGSLGRYLHPAKVDGLPAEPQFYRPCDAGLDAER